MNKIIIAIIGILVIVLGGYLFFKSTYQPVPVNQMPNQQVPSTSETTTVQSPVVQAPTVKENVVIHTDAGFSPATLRIKKGERVIFKNEGTRSMWVASNPHPVHSDYPGFDAKRTYAKGESYSFSFIYSGNWKYHNHLNPTEGGVIVVE